MEEVKKEQTEAAEEQKASEEGQRTEEREDRPSYEELEQRVKELEREKEELYDKLLRLHAEFENFRKRIQRELELHKELANESIIKELLVVVDNFERALESLEKDGQTDSFAEGVKLIYKQLKELLRRFGVEEIEAEGKKFDPNLHEAVMQVEHEEDNIVVQEVQKGYRLKGKLIRPSKVIVSKKKTA